VYDHVRQRSIWAGLASVPDQFGLQIFYPFAPLVGPIPLSCWTEAKSLSRAVWPLRRTERAFNLLANLASHYLPTLNSRSSFEVDSDPAPEHITEPECYRLFRLLTYGGVLLLHGTFDLSSLCRSARLGNAR
jgi:hypothetical protein